MLEENRPGSVSKTIDTMEDAGTVLTTLRELVEEKDAELAGSLYTLEDYYERKLWYQLSDLLKREVYKNPNSKSIQLKLYDNFIRTFSRKINQLQLVEFLVLSIEDLPPLEGLEYLTNLKSDIQALDETKNRKGGASIDVDINDYEITQALLYLQNEIATYKLQLGLYDEASSIVDENEVKIDNLSYSVDNRVNSSFYKAKALLTKFKGDYNSFYYNSLLFLSCIENIEDLNNKDKIVEDICVSGLLGDKIYNFGEIIMHEIFNYLKNDWLKDLILCLNEGNLGKFNKLIETKTELNKFTDILNKIDFLKQKICIMAFIELVFSKPTTNRNIKYEEILNKIELLETESEVEYLIMKCLSLGLIKGLINGVGQSIEVNWIQPHTMTTKQIENMKDRMEVWQKKVSGMQEYMAQCGGDLYRV